ncbi:hypothetical protein [Cryobacterium tagatosivorans]|nr:hypothetical protein [Cryobacterium tagatosivorans]
MIFKALLLARKRRRISHNVGLVGVTISRLIDYHVRSLLLIGAQ